MTLQNVLRGLAAAALAAGGLGVAATPAQAAADLSLVYGDSTVAFNAVQVEFPVNVKNSGDDRPTEVRVRLDATLLDPRITFSEGGDCTTVARVTECKGAVYNPSPGETTGLVHRINLGGAENLGDHGKLTVSVFADDDTEPADSRTLDFDLTREPLIDLHVQAVDVTDASNWGAIGKPLRPGGRGIAAALVENVGGFDTRDLRFSVKLPKGLTFVSKDNPRWDYRKHCRFNSAMTRMDCQYQGPALVPHRYAMFGADYFDFDIAVKLAKDAKGPATVGGGSWSAGAKPAPPREGMILQDPPASSTPRTGPEYDATPKDNIDTFSVRIAGPTGGSGGSTGGSSGGGAGGPTLPITGPSALAGLGLLVVGLMFVMVGRKRRV